MLLVVVDGSAAAEEITVVDTHIIMERKMSTTRITAEGDLETLIVVIKEDDITKQEEGMESPVVNRMRE